MFLRILVKTFQCFSTNAVEYWKALKWEIGDRRVNAATGIFPKHCSE